MIQDTPGDEHGPEIISFWAAQGLDLCHRLVGDDLGHFKLVENLRTVDFNESSERRIIEIQALAHYHCDIVHMKQWRRVNEEIPKYKTENFSRPPPSLNTCGVVFVFYSTHES